jgi:response regulator of citrate/malate metabolism
MNQFDELLSFEDDSTEKIQPESQDKWKILIVDDDEGIHTVTKLAINDFVFDDKRLTLLHAMNAKDAKTILKDDPDIALALIDVVMETEHAGLELVDFIRNELKNSLIRLILRTGQPGSAPERDVILKYDINDYKIKPELTSSRLFTSVIGALRSYRDAKEIVRQKYELDELRLAQMDKRVEAALGIGNEELIKAIPIPCAMFDKDNIITTANRHFLDTFKCQIGTDISTVQPFLDDNNEFDGVWDVKSLCINESFRSHVFLSSLDKLYAIEFCYISKLNRWLVFLLGHI